MIQLCSGLCFLEEARFVLLGRVKVRGQKLESDEAVELRVQRFVDNTHSSLTELLKNLIMGNYLTNHDSRLPALVQF